MDFKLKAKHETYDDVRREYFRGKCTQLEIARKYGISERTLRNWIHDGCWKKLKEDADIAPAAMIESYISQMIELQQNIGARPPGSRYPLPHEIDTQRKLLNCIIKVKDYPRDFIRSFSYGNTPISDLVFSEDLPPGDVEVIRAEQSFFTLYVNAQTGNQNNFEKPAIPGNDTTQIIDNEQIKSENEISAPGKKAAEKRQLPLPAQIPEFVGNEDEISSFSNNYGNEQTDHPDEQKEKLVFKSGAIWIRRSDVYDPKIQQVRLMTVEEVDEFADLGFPNTNQSEPSPSDSM